MRVGDSIVIDALARVVAVRLAAVALTPIDRLFYLLILILVIINERVERRLQDELHELPAVEFETAERLYRLRELRRFFELARPDAEPRLRVQVLQRHLVSSRQREHVAALIGPEPQRLARPDDPAALVEAERPAVALERPLHLVHARLRRGAHRDVRPALVRRDPEGPDAPAAGEEEDCNQ